MDAPHIEKVEDSNHDKNRPSASGKSRLEILAPTFPTLLWVLLAIVIGFQYNDLITAALKDAAKLKVGLFELERRISRASEKLARNPELQKDHVVVPDDPLRKSFIARWKSLNLDGHQIRVLLIHDQFRVAKVLREPLEDLGFLVDLGICPQEAETLLRRHRYDVVISDIEWRECSVSKGTPSRGVEFLRHSQREGFNQPTIFFIGDYRPELGTPPFAVGITNNWFQMLHLVLDVLERKPQHGAEGDTRQTATAG